MAARAEIRALRVPAVPFGAALLAAWAIGMVLVLVVRPGFVLEFATIGIVGWVAWRTLLRQLGWIDLVVGLACFLVPLLNTWPARVYQSFPDHLPPPLPALLGASSLAAILLVALRVPLRMSALPRLVVAAATAFIFGGLFAAVLTDDVAVSIAALWSTAIVPIVLAAIITSSVNSPERGWRVLSLIGLAALVPMTVAVAAFVLSFGVPQTADDLVAAKTMLYRPHLLQDATLGNVGHLADFALLVMPATLLGVSRARSPRALRAALILAAIGSVLLLVITVSRSALLIGAVVALGLTVAMAIRRDWRASTPPLVACAVLLAVSFSQPIRSSLTQLVPQVTVGAAPSPVTPGAPPARPSPGPRATASTSGGPSFVEQARIGSVAIGSGEESERQRIDALRTGLAVFAQRMPFGVGPGRYETYDRTHTASHSLFVETLAEYGILGGLAIILLVLLVLQTGVRSALRPSREHDLYLLQVAAAAGAGGFLAQGILAGAPLAMGPVNIWATLLWVQLNLAAMRLGKVPER